MRTSFERRGYFKGALSWIRFYLVVLIVTGCLGAVLRMLSHKPSNEIAIVLAVPIILFVAPPFLLIRLLGIVEFSVKETPRLSAAETKESTEGTKAWSPEAVAARKSLGQSLARVMDAISGIGLPLGAASVFATILLLSAPVYSILEVRWAIIPVTGLAILVFFLSGIVKTLCNKQVPLVTLAFGFLLWLLFTSREEPPRNTPSAVIMPFRVWRTILPPL